MLEDSLVSIAMSSYNGERFIKEQIDSILEQSHSNFELIITDDGSSDTTIEIIKNYQKNDTRIKLYQNEVNLGFVQNFGKAISHHHIMNFNIGVVVGIHIVSQKIE